MLALVAAAAVSIAAVPAQRLGDVLVRTDGSRLRGVEITDGSLAGVLGKRGNDAFAVPAQQVASIEWSGAPEAFLAGRAALDRGDFRGAVQWFGDVVSDRPLLAADAGFFKVEAAVAAIGNDKAAAATAASHAQRWLADHANHWRTPAAMLLAGRAERLAGAATAVATLGELDDRATREGFGPVWIVRAKLELGQALLAAGKAEAARAMQQAAATVADLALAAAAADATALRSLRTMARVAEGESHLAGRDFAKAAAFFRGMVDSHQPDLVGAGQAGLGEALFLAATGDRRVADLRAAQRCFAAASTSDAHSGDASAKANYYLGRCLFALGPEHEGEAWKQRANAYFQIVLTHYPTSRWAAPARAAKVM